MHLSMSCPHPHLWDWSPLNLAPAVGADENHQPIDLGNHTPTFTHNTLPYIDTRWCISSLVIQKHAPQFLVKGLASKKNSYTWCDSFQVQQAGEGYCALQSTCAQLFLQMII